MLASPYCLPLSPNLVHKLSEIGKSEFKPGPSPVLMANVKRLIRSKLEQLYK